MTAKIDSILYYANICKQRQNVYSFYIVESKYPINRIATTVK